MSESKKYFYLKVKETFFDSEEMKILESQKNGILYQNLYLKLSLLSLKSEGALLFKDAIPYDETMLSSILRVDIDTVHVGLDLFRQLKLVEVLENGVIYMSDIQSLIGRSSSEAERIKAYRERIKIESDELKKPTKRKRTNVQKRTPELELDTESEKELDTDTGESMKLAFLLLTEHRKIDPNFLADKARERLSLLGWSRDIEKLIRIDKRGPEDIRRIITWCQTDGNFWAPNILSGKKLREKFPQLVLQAKSSAPEKSALEKAFEIMEERERERKGAVV